MGLNESIRKFDYNKPNDNLKLSIDFFEKDDFESFQSKIGYLDKKHFNIRLIKDYDSYKSENVQVIYLPITGASDKKFKRTIPNVNKAENEIFFFRFFNKKELGYYKEFEIPPLKTLWADVRETFTNAPFLVYDDKCTDNLFSEWISLILTLKKHCYEKNVENRKLADNYSKATELLSTCPSIENKDSIDNLLNLINIHYAAFDLFEKINDTQKKINDLMLEIERCREELYILSEKQYKITGKESYGADFNVNLGAEITNNFQKYHQILSEFTEKLTKSNIGTLKEIGEDLNRKLSHSPPILALIGPYSSGKTTLLNLLLFGKGSTHLFRTKTTANTSLIFELTYTADKDLVEYDFRKEIDCFLSDETLPKNINMLIALLNNDILIDTEILDDNKRKKITNKKDVVSILEKFNENNKVSNKISLRAKVNRERIKELSEYNDKLPDYIDLSDDSGWNFFQGNEEAIIKPQCEELVASFLIKKANVKLKTPILIFTTIADTPGTGSCNDIHDVITEQYLNMAEGVIFLLPTNVLAAQRVEDLFQKLKKKENKMDEIAFVVNCSSSQTEDSIKKAIVEFENKIKKTFKLNDDEWFRRKQIPNKNNFFVVKLKGIETGQNYENLYGYSSLIQLRKWIKNLFSTGAYKKRYEEFQKIIEINWGSRKQTKVDELDQCDKGVDDLKKKAKMLEKFRENELKELKEKQLNYINNIKEDLKEEEEKVSYALNNYYNNPYENPFHEDDLENFKILHRRVINSIEEINKKLDEFDKNDPAKKWMAEIEYEFNKLKMSPPLIPQADYKSKNKIRIHKNTFDSIDSIFYKIEADWPSYNWRRWHIKLWQDIQGYFSDNFWVINARKLHDEWESHYKNYIKPNNKEIFEICENHITDSVQKIENYCKNKEKVLTTSSIIDRQRNLKNEINGFVEFEKERLSIINILKHEFFAKGE